MIKKSMSVLLILVFLTASLVLISSCATTSKEDPQDAAKIAAERDKERIRQEEARRAEQERQQRLADEAERQRLERERLAREEAAQLKKKVESEIIYFDYDRSELKPEARDILNRKADWLKENREYNIRIEGHCDERGSTEYNLALGERRAEAAAKFLKALGIAEGRISVVSYGEQMPADPGKNEAAWAKNRRDEFKLEK